MRIPVRIFFVFIGLLLLGAVVLSANGQTGIVVDNADSIRTDNVISSSGLNGVIASVTPRVIVEFVKNTRHFGLIDLPSAFQTTLNQVSDRVVFEFANANRKEGLPSVPTELNTELTQIADRIVFEFANASREEGLVNVPTELGTWLNQMADRIIFEFANANREVLLNYPLALLGDQTPPQISEIATNPLTDGSVDITWTTNEFSDSIVQYGTQPGVYLYTVSDPLYVKEHTITLTNIESGITYYYRVSSTDQSGNTYQSVEDSFTAEISVYLPIIVK